MFIKGKRFCGCSLIWQILGSSCNFLCCPLLGSCLISLYRPWLWKKTALLIAVCDVGEYIIMDVAHWSHLARHIKINSLIFCQERLSTICSQIKINELKKTLTRNSPTFAGSFRYKIPLNENRIIHANTIEFNLFLLLKKELEGRKIFIM